MTKRRRLAYDAVAVAGLALVVYGVREYSEPLAFIVVGLGIAIAAEVIAAFPRKPRGL